VRLFLLQKQRPFLGPLDKKRLPQMKAVTDLLFTAHRVRPQRIADGFK
jgi:hypothetical protein